MADGTVSTASSSAAHPDDMFTAVVDYPGVVSSPALRRLKLGIVGSHDVLCCIECPRIQLLKLSAAPTHAHSHMKNKRAYSSNAMLALCSKYNVYNGRIADMPIPPHPAAPLPFLPKEEGLLCLLCEDKGVQFATRSEKTMSNHFNTHKRAVARHKGGARPERAVTVQTFCTSHQVKKWFQVFPDLEGPPDPEDLHSSPAPPEEMLRAVIRSWRPVDHGPVSVSSVKEVQPWLHFNGWVSHISRYDLAFLCGLVESPEPGSPLGRIVKAAMREFELDQETIPNTAYVFRTEIMDEGTGPPKHEFRQLEDATAHEYGRYWGLFVAFVMRLRRMELEGDGRYAVTMTPSQKRCVDRAWKYAEVEKDRPSGRRVLLDVSRWFWCPDTMEDFSHLATDQFDDPTVRFGILINMRPDGSFLEPGNASHLLVRIKYFIRAALFMWSRDTQRRKQLPVQSIVYSISPGLTRRCLSPFSSTSIAVSLASMYAGTSTRAPNVLWTTETRATVEGQDIEFKEFQQAFLSSVERTEKLLKDSVLLGIAVEDYGLKIGPETVIHDSHARTDAGYSMFKDPRNPFRELRWAMAKKVFEREEGSGLHRGLDENGEVCWNEGAVGRWLDDYAECVRQHAFLMHLCGGQTSRGVEFCLMKVQNTAHRPRNFHWINPGTLAFLLYYGKGTNMTGMDRVVAHAVPWRLSHMFLVLHGLVNPFASMHVQRLAGDAASYVQQHSAFAVLGKELVSDQLSAECARFFQRLLKVKVGLRVLRQYMVACGRQLMPDAYGPVQQASNVVDSQAGHTSETALKNYGIIVGEHHLFMHNTIQKYIAASRRWWSVLCLDGMLEAEEVRAGARAPSELARLSLEGPDAPAFGRSGPCLGKDELADAIRDALKEGPLAESIAVKVAQAIGGPGARATAWEDQGPALPSTSESLGPNDEDPARPSVESRAADGIEEGGWKTGCGRLDMKHLAALRIYTGNKTDKWTSRGQAKAFVHALGRSSSLLVVLPTGGGKSVVFGAATLLEAGVTVVIAPLRALLLDQAKSLESRGVGVTVWAGDKDVPDGVVLASVEAATSVDFRTWLARLRAEKRLNRIVVDEVHLLRLSREYREAMSRLTGLVRSGVPLVGLSATVPPSWERELRGLLGEPSWRVIREATQRSNLVLRVAGFRDLKSADKSLRKHVERYVSELESGEGILVQCWSYADVKHVGELLGAPQYRKDLTNEERDRNAKDWLDGKSAVIVGTSGLGTGVHHRACRAVLHYKAPYGIVDYAQETGRAGRDGLPALCVIFTPRPLPSAPDVDTGGWEQMREMLDGSECMRLHMSRHLDGDELATTCAELGGDPCTRCAHLSEQIEGRDGVGLSMPEIPKPTKRWYRGEEWIEEHLPTFAAGPPAAREGLPRALTTSGEALLSERAKDTGVDAPVRVDGRADPVVLVSSTPEVGQSRVPPGQSRTQQEMVRRMAHDAPLAAPTGSIVSADAEAARVRESRVVEREVMVEEQLAPLNFPTLMDVKKKMERRCIWCVLHERSSLGHLMFRCKHAPGGGAWSLDPHEYKGMTFKEAKTVHELPANETVCFRCWWSLTQDHRENKLGCVGRDQVLQLCWLVLCDDELRASLRASFGLEEELEDGYAYVRWLSQTVREVQWYGTEQTLVVGHLVLLWVLYKEKKVFSY